jgi:hypothetical protein
MRASRVSGGAGAWLRAACLLAVSVQLACAAIQPARPPREIRLEQPLFQDLAIRGLAYRDERVAARRSELGAAEPVESPGPGSLVRRNKGSAVVIETYDSDELLRALQFALEDSGVARRVVPESRFAIDGVLLRAEPDTGIAQIARNIATGASMLWLAGSPFVGSVEAQVQLRVYVDGELSRTYQSSGRVNWQLSYQSAETIAQIKQRAKLEAARLAVRDTVVSIAQSPPADLDRPLPPFPSLKVPAGRSAPGTRPERKGERGGGESR